MPSSNCRDHVIELYVEGIPKSFRSARGCVLSSVIGSFQAKTKAGSERANSTKKSAGFKLSKRKGVIKSASIGPASCKLWKVREKTLTLLVEKRSDGSNPHC